MCVSGGLLCGWMCVGARACVCVCFYTCECVNVWVGGCLGARACVRVCVRACMCTRVIALGSACAIK